jgi:hypothetical protein
MDRHQTDRQAKTTVSVCDPAIRLQREAPTSMKEEDVLRYALLMYVNSEVRDRMPEEERRRITTAAHEMLARPNVTGWLVLEDVESATTVRSQQGRTLLTDGPFVDSKDVLGGFIVVEAENLDGALALAGELEAKRCADAIEVRPVREENP